MSTDDNDLSEDIAPESGPTWLSENLTPDSSPTFMVPKVDVEGMESKTRRALAYGAGIVLAAFYTATFILHATNVLPDLGNIMSMFSGLQTLTAAAFGFYFAKATGGK